MTNQAKYTNPWSEFGISSFPPPAPMVGQENVRRQLESTLKNFQPAPGGSAWFTLLASTWGGGKTRTAHEIISQTTGLSQGWIDRAGNQLPSLVKADFEDGLLPVMVSYKRIIRTVEEAGMKLPFTEWIPRVAYAGLCALKTENSPELREIRAHLQTIKPAVYKALKILPDLDKVKNISDTLNAFIETMKQNGLARLFIIVEEVEDPTEIRNKPGRVLGEEAYQEIKDTYLDVIPEVFKSDIERQKFPNLGFLLLCSPAVYSAVDRIPSQERRLYRIPIGRNTVADLCGYLNYLRKENPQIPAYSEELIRAAYFSVDRNMGWMNVVMYSIHRRWIEGEGNPVSLLREFAEADPRGKEVFVENALARIPGAETFTKAQELLFGQTPAPIQEIDEQVRHALLQIKVTDAVGSVAFTELYSLSAELSELLQSARNEPGVQVISGGGSKVRAGDVEIDLAKVLEDLTAYSHDGAGRPLVPKDKELFIAHLTSLHGISQTGAAGEYLYPVFAGYISEQPTHIGPSFPALRELNKRLQREDFQSRLLDDEEEDRHLKKTLASVSQNDRLRRIRDGLLQMLEEIQSPQEDMAEGHLNVSVVGIERTHQLLLAQDGKILIIIGEQGQAINNTLESLCGQDKPVRPILLVLTSGELSQRELVEGFLKNRPATFERVFFFPLADLDERLLFLKSENPQDESLTNLARSLLYRLRERVRESFSSRFQQLLEDGVIVRRLFRSHDWKSQANDLAELWLYLAADESRTLTDARSHFKEPLIEHAQEALTANRPTHKTFPEPLVDHDTDPPKPIWSAGLARMVHLIAKTPQISISRLAMRFFGHEAKPRIIIEEMLEWLFRLGIIVYEDSGQKVRLTTRGHIENMINAANSWYQGDFQKVLSDLTKFKKLSEEIKARGNEFMNKLKALQQETLLQTVAQFGIILSGKAGSDEPFTDEMKESWSVLGALLAFHRWEMETSKVARGKQLGNSGAVLEQHIKYGDIPFRDYADGIGEFSNKLQTRVNIFHKHVDEAKSRLEGEIKSQNLSEMVICGPIEALKLITQLEGQLDRSTHGIARVETVIHSMVREEFKQAEDRLTSAEQMLQILEENCRAWIEEWENFRAKVHTLSARLQAIEDQSLDSSTEDHVYVKNHLLKLKKNLHPEIEETRDLVNSLEDIIAGDYNDLIAQKDRGSAPFNQDNSPFLLTEAQKLLNQLFQGSKVCVSLVEEKLGELETARKQYAAELMQEMGSPDDPGLGLLRYAIARLDESATTQAEKRLEGTTAFRSLIEEAYKIREEWRSRGPRKLGDDDLFRFFLKVIHDTNLGSRPIPPGTDWVKLGRLKDQNLITLSLRN